MTPFGGFEGFRSKKSVGSVSRFSTSSFSGGLCSLASGFGRFSFSPLFNGFNISLLP
jgi:hypothetical protein